MVEAAVGVLPEGAAVSAVVVGVLPVAVEGSVPRGEARPLAVVVEVLPVVAEEVSLQGAVVVVVTKRVLDDTSSSFPPHSNRQQL